MNNKNKIILIVGPTSIGKTKLSIMLAKKYNADIINADSRYIFKEPIIATCKIAKSEMDGITHHMIDLVSLNDDYSIYDYQKEGRKVLNKLINANKNIIIVGGSGLYIKALLYDYKFDDEELKYDFSKYTNKELKDISNKIDINNNIHVNNRKRLERYISYFYNNKKALMQTNNKNIRMYNFDVIGLNINRNKLYNNINSRVEYMFENGLLKEAKKLKDYKHFKDIIGYKELIPYFNNEVDLELAKENVKKDTRNYAKRQLTWFNNQIENIKWYDLDNYTFEQILFEN